MNIPSNLKYTKDDEWIRLEGEFGYIGITDYAQHELGDITFIDIDPDLVGETLEAEEVPASELDHDGTVKAWEHANQLIDERRKWLDEEHDRQDKIHNICNEFAEKAEAFVRDGGTFIATFLSGVVDKNVLVYPGGFPGPFRKQIGRAHV